MKGSPVRVRASALRNTCKSVPSVVSLEDDDECAGTSASHEPVNGPPSRCCRDELCGSGALAHDINDFGHASGNADVPYVTKLKRGMSAP
jgi:hypothetical protein